jgi:hypothetical protein
MIVEIFEISFDAYAKRMAGVPGEEVLLSAAKLATDLIVATYGEETLVYIGLIPPTLLSDEAYIWMLTTEAGHRHPILLARYARGFIDTALTKYRALYGHCFEPKSAHWLRYLGAEFHTETQFKIRRG